MKVGESDAIKISVAKREDFKISAAKGESLEARVTENEALKIKGKEKEGLMISIPEKEYLRLKAIESEFLKMKGAKSDLLKLRSSRKKAPKIKPAKIDALKMKRTEKDLKAVLADNGTTNNVAAESDKQDKTADIRAARNDDSASQVAILHTVISEAATPRRRISWRERFRRFFTCCFRPQLEDDNVADNEGTAESQPAYNETTFLALTATSSSVH